MSRLEVWGVPLPGEVRPGDDLAALLAAAEPALADGDVLVVTSKVVGKAEGRLVPCPPDPAGREAARQAAVAAETVRVVAARDRTRIVETRHGFVLAAAGVDASNTAPDTLVLLPADPDASARRLRDGLRDRLGVEVAVVVSDTFGRPWRHGLVDVAVGAAGIAPLRDYRGGTDGHGNPLAMTEMADVDALAAATELVKGKLAGVPAAVVRGLAYARSDAGVRALVRPPGEDMFRLGTAEALAEGRRQVLDGLAGAAGAAGEVGLLGAPPGVLTEPCADPVAAVLREVAGWGPDGARGLLGTGGVTVFYQQDARRVIVQCRWERDLVAAGMVTARVVAALVAAGVPATVTSTDGLGGGAGHPQAQTVAVVGLGPAGGPAER